ncbi:hypothetical protein AB7C87_07475 [Natrarchaeobius sp. A-rgal3]|uniref:hypothetical protein n=1 Tax=Natrarchaeobius versutus TaxID=1679078 RepID=UPI00350F231A
MATTHSSTNIGENAPLPESLNDSEGRYLLAIYWLSSQNTACIRTGELATELEITPGSTTEMVTELSTAGLVDHEKYRRRRDDDSRRDTVCCDDLPVQPRVVLRLHRQ